MCATALSAAMPLQNADGPRGNFSITNFGFSCTYECYWSFDVSVQGNFTNHPGFDTPVICGGNLGRQGFIINICTPPESDGFASQIRPYVDENNILKLAYLVSDPDEHVSHWFEGHRHLKPAAVGKPEPRQFIVPETIVKDVP